MDDLRADLVEMLKDKYESYLDFVKDLNEYFEFLKELNDTELRLYNKNHCFKSGGNYTLLPTNFSDFPEFKEDIVMQRVASLYKKLNHEIDHLPYKTKNYDTIKKEVEEIDLSLSRFATDMANRSMKEGTYLALLENKHEILDKGRSLILRLSKKNYQEKKQQERAYILA